MNAETATFVIKDSTLKFSNPRNFNDPLDYYPTIPKTGFGKFVRRINNEIGKGKKPYKLNHANTQQHLVNLRSEQFREKYTSQMCISCFSKSPFILPMWAHYADNHKGVVIEFTYEETLEIRKELIFSQPNKPISTLIPLEVIYSNNRPPLFDEYGKTNSETTGVNACLTKAKTWEYEQELRVVRMQPEGIYSFNRSQMSAVYFGLKINSEHKKELSRLIDSSNNHTKTKIKKHDVEIAFDKFELTKVSFRL